LLIPATAVTLHYVRASSGVWRAMKAVLERRGVVFIDERDSVERGWCAPSRFLP
jgi:hypothetical protein